MALLKLEEYYTSSISLFRTVLADCDGAESEVVTLEALEIRTGHGFAYNSGLSNSSAPGVDIVLDTNDL